MLGEIVNTAVYTQRMFAITLLYLDEVKHRIQAQGSQQQIGIRKGGTKLSPQFSEINEPKLEGAR